MPNQDGFLIWWLCQQDCEEIGPISSCNPVPKYIADEYRSLLGRNGRGRLWVSSEIEKEFGSFIPWDDNLPIAKRLGESYAGVAFRREDFKFVQLLAGIVTDCKLVRVTSLK